VTIVRRFACPALGAESLAPRSCAWLRLWRHTRIWCARQQSELMRARSRHVTSRPALAKALWNKVPDHALLLADRYFIDYESPQTVQQEISGILLAYNLVSRAPARVPRADHSGVKLQGRSGMSVCRRRVCSSSHTPIEHWSSFAPRSAWVRAGDHSLARLSSTPQG
jgi:hypothetical protein